MLYRKLTKVAHCVACGCDDYHACEEGCWWIEVDRARGIGVCSSCELEHDIDVYCLGPGVWIAGTGTAEEVVAAYEKRTGRPVADTAGAVDSSPAALSHTALWTTKVDGPDGVRPGSPHSIAETIKALVIANAPMPCLLRHAAG